MSNRETSHTTLGAVDVLWLALPLAALAALAAGVPLAATAALSALAWFALFAYVLLTRRRERVVRTPPGVADRAS